MRGRWKAKVLLPLERVVQAIEDSLTRLGSTFRKSHSYASLGRRVEIFWIASPMRFTLKARESGLIFSLGEKRRDSALTISETEGSNPFLRSFLLELARHLPYPPWHREEEARDAARKTWLKVLALTALPLGLGLVYMFSTLSSALLQLILLVSNAAAIVVPLAVIVLTHPDVDSRIQRWKWRRWIGDPELAALGWAEKPHLK